MDVIECQEEFRKYLKYIHDEPEDSDEWYVKAFLLYLVKKHILRKSPVFSHCTKEHEILKVLREAESWEVPGYYLTDEHVPYYYTGRTEDGSAVWVAEAGRPDPRDLLKDPKALKALDRTILQMTQSTAKSWLTRDPNVRFRGVKVLVDLEGLEMARLANFRVISLGITLSKRYMDIADEILDELVFINANCIADYFLNKFGWLISKLLKKAKVYGQDRSEWLPVIRETFPAHALPVKYGGSLDLPPLYAHEYADKFRDVAFTKCIFEKNVIPR